MPEDDRGLSSQPIRFVPASSDPRLVRSRRRIPTGMRSLRRDQGLPVLHNRYLVGVSDMADVGREPGRPEHGHTVTAPNTHGRTTGPNASNDNGSLQKDGGQRHNHEHPVSGKPNRVSNIPPCVTVIYKMKL